ncbi:MAG: RNA polymerase sigma factor [Planctomycetota bacterium]
MERTLEHRIDELLAEQGFVRDLARSLVRDGGEAEDLAQDCWLAALRNPPAPGRDLRAWVVTTLRRLTMRRRAQQRARLLRERAAARPEALPSAASVAARESARRDLVQTLLAMPEPYRGVLLARYYDGLAPKDIAARMGAPAATVRSWLRRGLAELRERLDERSGGDRGRWALALLPWTLPALPGAAAMTTTGMVTAMSTKKFLAGVAGLLLLATGTAFLLRQSPTTAATSPDEGSVLAGAAGEDAHDAGSAERGPAERRTLGAPRPSTSGDAWSLLLVDADGRPAAGLPWFLDPAGRPQLTTGGLRADLLVPNLAGGTSDADGRVTLASCVAPEAWLWVRVLPGCLAAFDLRGREAGQALHLPATPSFEVSCAGTFPRDSWQVAVRPSWRLPDGGFAHNGYMLAFPTGDVAALHLSDRRIELDGPGPHDVPVVGTGFWELRATGREFVVAAEEPADRRAPARWTFALARRCPAVRVVVLDERHQPMTHVPGVLHIAREGDERLAQVELEDGEARVGWIDLARGDRLALMALLDGGAVLEERHEVRKDVGDETVTLRWTRRKEARELLAVVDPLRSGFRDLLASDVLVHDRKGGWRSAVTPDVWNLEHEGLMTWRDEGRLFALPAPDLHPDDLWLVDREGPIAHVDWHGKRGPLMAEELRRVPVEPVDTRRWARGTTPVALHLQVRLGGPTEGAWHSLRHVSLPPADGRFPVWNVEIPATSEARLRVVAQDGVVDLPLAVRR